MSAFPEVFLKEGKERSLLRFHPWVYSGAVAKVEGAPLCGDTVKVVSRKGEFLAYGAYSPESRIPVKIWSFRETETIDRAFFEHRLEAAYRLRLAVFNQKLPEAYRLVCAESDGMPGLIADIYQDYAVCQITGAGMEHFRTLIGELLLKYAAKGVYERSDVDSRLKDGLPERVGVLAGSPPPEWIPFTENGIPFRCDPYHGHKTGFYLDQRMNRKAVMEASSGVGTVLNCFSYTGGFGLAALKGGASEVLNVDVSAQALETARENARMNGFSDAQFQTQEADVFQFLRTCRDSRKRFDMIILDPPKFAENYAHKEKAARGYKDINLLALKLLNPGGKLFTFSCSGAMDDDLFGKVVDSAACDAKADFRITHWLSQGPDHPVASAFPEGRYLKGLGGVVL